MDLRVVGAGLGRTGTNSLKLALEQLLGGRCHHMIEVFADERQFPLWVAALDGAPPDWQAIFDGFVATVDWPSVAFWRELVTANPDAVVVLSQRESAEAWWGSASKTIFVGLDGDGAGPPPPLRDAIMSMFRRTGIDPLDHDAAVAGYEAHLAAVRAEVPADRLVEWQPGDGWAPLCAALDLPVPDAPFPHVNTTDDFTAARAARIAAAEQ